MYFRVGMLTCGPGRAADMLRRRWDSQLAREIDQVISLMAAGLCYLLRSHRFPAA